MFKNTFSNDRTKLGLVVAGLGMLGTLLVAGASDAGLKGTNQIVIINSTTRTATGSLGLARNSANNVEYIGCSRDSAGTVSCSATNSAGTAVSCAASNSTLANVLNSMDGDSFVSFTWDTAGTCTRIYVDNYSFWPQKAP